METYVILRFSAASGMGILAAKVGSASPCDRAHIGAKVMVSGPDRPGADRGGSQP
jgi:hypothetical protein